MLITFVNKDVRIKSIVNFDKCGTVEFTHWNDDYRITFYTIDRKVLYEHHFPDEESARDALRQIYIQSMSEKQSVLISE